jgi:hypothetical protein
MAYLLIVPFLLLDIISCVCGLRRNLRGHGPSGVPVVSLIAYAMFEWFLPDPKIFGSKVTEFLVLLVFHLITQFISPVVHRKILSSKKPKVPE